eukprot:4947693-Amphidinium_carterae.1
MNAFLWALEEQLTLDLRKLEMREETFLRSRAKERIHSPTLESPWRTGQTFRHQDNIRDSMCSSMSSHGQEGGQASGVDPLIADLAAFSQAGLLAAEAGD